MKKLFTLLLMMASVFLMVSCTQTKKAEEKVYDTEFLKSLATGLEKRWKISDSENWTESAKNYKQLIQTELDEVGSYTDKKFESSKLQELAISYINELKNGLTVAESYGADSFYVGFAEHTDKRTAILVDINSLKVIPVKDEDTLDELLAKGKEAKTANEKDNAIKNLINSVTFTLDESKSDEYSKIYFAEVENTTSYTIDNLSVSVNLIDANGTTVYTTYVNANNWRPGTRTRFEFYGSNNDFVKTESIVEYYTAK